ncbi:MAG: DUF5615 family PIN-like protein [Deltaproteobacteria bacterium]|nr:DUF5615 family PIN-like protein [Deltaproteobacteria bacterium]
MKLKLDENLSRHLKEDLVFLGHDALTAAEEGLLSRPDDVIAAAAKAEGRMLLTLDLHLADITRFRPGSHPGIILFRPPSLGPLTVNSFISEFVRGQDLAIYSGCLAVIEPGRARVRRPEE